MRHAGQAHRGFKPFRSETVCQTRRGGPRGWPGPSRMPTDVGCPEGSGGAAAAATGATRTKAVGGSTSAVACARPRQHACAAAAVGDELLWVSPAAEALQKTVHKVDGAPSRSKAAWAGGCRKWCVFANSATAIAWAGHP